MELGLFSFAEVHTDPRASGSVTVERRLLNLLEEIELADQVGLDVFGIGQHHRPDFAVATPAIVLAAAAARTKRIRLTSAVTVLSSDDPVRVFQEFSTVDLLSGGRAEIMAGRGSFIESYPLFGYDLHDYDSLFEEKLDLLLKLRAGSNVTWSGRHRAALRNQPVYPRPVQDPLPVWIAVGGTPASVVRAGKLGLPLAVAIIGGRPAPFTQLVDLYRHTARAAGHDPATLPVGINSHGFIADSSKAAIEAYYPRYLDVMGRLGRERGWPPPTRSRFDAEVGPGGALLVGTAEEVAEKIVEEHALFANDRFLLQLGIGGPTHAEMMRSIELFGTKVAPLVHAELASPAQSSGTRRTASASTP